MVESFKDISTFSFSSEFEFAYGILKNCKNRSMKRDGFREVLK